MRASYIAVLATSGGCMLARPVAAASAAFAAPQAPAVLPDGVAVHMVQTVLALTLVLALVFALAWASRRIRGSARAAGTGISVLAQLSLGGKERVVLLQTPDSRVLVGVSPGSVRALQVLAVEPAQAVEPAATEAQSSRTISSNFRDLLRRSLGAP